MNLNERFVTIQNKDKELKDKYFEQVYAILEKSYSPIGGLISLDYPEEIKEDKYIWKLVRRNEHVTACVLYKGSMSNRKIALAGTDQTPQGKSDLYMILKEDIDMIDRGVWGELSGAMEHIYIDKLHGKRIPSDVSIAIMRLLGKNPSKLAIDDKDRNTHYTRSIGGIEHKKALVGNPPEEFVNKAMRFKRESVSSEQDLGKYYDDELARQVERMNKFLDMYGFEVEIIDDDDLLQELNDNDVAGMFFNSIQDNASVFPIGINKKMICDESENTTDVRYGIVGTLAHEVGHGIFQYCNDMIDLDDLDEEDVVEEFAIAYEDGTLDSNELMNIINQSLNEDLTKGQQEYFKNSKVRDASGNLLVCYHGTTKPGFNEFDSSKGDSQFGKYKFDNANVNYFTTDKRSATSYTELGIEQDGNVYACYINIENPFVVDNKSTSDIKSSFNIKDVRVRQKHIELFNRMWDIYCYSADVDDVDEINENFLNPMNLELRESDESGYFDLVELGNNSLFGNERIKLYSYRLDELFDDDMHDELRSEIIGEDDDDYYLTTDMIVKYVLYMNKHEGTDYDGIIIDDIIDSKDMFSLAGTDVITLKSSNQIKLIDNENPTKSNKITEKTEEIDDKKSSTPKSIDEAVLSERDMHIEFSADAMRNVLNNTNDVVKVFYDRDNEYYLWTKNLWDYVHSNLIYQAYRDGYYPGYENEDDVLDHFLNEDERCIYIVWVPEYTDFYGSDKEADEDLLSDGYDRKFRCTFGYAYTRYEGGYLAFEKCPLYDKLGAESTEFIESSDVHESLDVINTEEGEDSLLITNSAEEAVMWIRKQLRRKDECKIVYAKDDDCYLLIDSYFHIHSDAIESAVKKGYIHGQSSCICMDVFSPTYNDKDIMLDDWDGQGYDIPVYAYDDMEIASVQGIDLSHTSLIRRLGDCMLYKWPEDKDKILEKIVKKGSKYQVQSEKGKNLGTYDTKKEAEKRLKDVEMFKHMDEALLRGDSLEQVWVFDSPYQVKSFLLSKLNEMKPDEGYRVYIYNDSLYAIGSIWDVTHQYLVYVAAENGYDMRFDELSGKSICIIFAGKESSSDKYFEDDYVTSDGYDRRYEYDNFNVYSREYDFSKFTLSSVLGKFKMQYLTESKEDLNEAFTQADYSDDAVDGTCGYVLDDGSIHVLDEYHGEDKDMRDSGYPEFSNTHPEEDTCIRIYDAPNGKQYKTIEKIIDFYLEKEGYCKIELWSSRHGYYFYETYSLWEDAGDCSDIERVGNWTGSQLVQVIKHNIKNNASTIGEEWLKDLRLHARLKKREE